MRRATVFLGMATPVDRPGVFRPSCDAIRQLLVARKWIVTMVDAQGAYGLEALRQVPPSQDMLVFVGHGGWDGPFLGAHDEVGYVQASKGHGFQALWPEFVDALRSRVRPGGLVVALSCHSAGSTPLEEENPFLPYEPPWIQQVALFVPVFVIGMRGRTPAANSDVARRVVSFAMDGEPAVPLASVYGPGWTPLKTWRGWWAHARAFYAGERAGS